MFGEIKKVCEKKWIKEKRVCAREGYGENVFEKGELAVTSGN